MIKHVIQPRTTADFNLMSFQKLQINDFVVYEPDLFLHDSRNVRTFAMFSMLGARQEMYNSFRYLSF